LNSGPCIYEAGALLLGPYSQPFLLQLVFE
jgi:hypothetical protein